MRLAIVSTMDSIPWGGSEELWATAAAEALRRGLSVDLFLNAWPDTPPRVRQLQAAGARVHFRAVGVAPLATRLAAKVFGRPLYFTQQLRQVRPDAILLSMGNAYDLAKFPRTITDLLALGIPYATVVQHNDDMPVGAGRRAQAIRLYDGAALNAFVSAGNLACAERQLAHAIPNAVVVQNPLGCPDLRRVEWPAATPAKFASVARLETAFKGQDLLFEALGAESWKDRPWELSLYGNGSETRYLQQLAKHYGIDSHVRFPGHQSDIGTVWADNHLLVLPSRSEGTSLALLEALLAGRPAVVTDVGDSARWVSEGETGFVAEGCTAASVGRALERAWARRADWPEMGLRAHEYALANLDPNPGRTLLDAVRRAAGFAGVAEAAVAAPQV